MTTELTRLPALPTEIRDNFQIDPRVSGFRKGPEQTNSAHSIHRLETSEQAALRLSEIVYYRGRAHAGGYHGGTEVFVVAVYDGHVVARGDMQVYRNYNRKKKVHFWNTLGAEVDWDDARQRKQAIIAGEHKVVAQMKESHARLWTLAKKALAKTAHEALASTKLVKVRHEIATTVVRLKDLRAEEKKLARQAEKEEAAA